MYIYLNVYKYNVSVLFVVNMYKDILHYSKNTIAFDEELVI